MTTITYRDGVMAADSGEAWGDEIRANAVKIYNTGKYLVGLSGNFAAVVSYIEWITDIQDSHDNPSTMFRDKDLLMNSPNNGVNILMVDRDGGIWAMTTEGHATTRAYEYDSIGSGGAYAMGAMHCGAGAEEAVKAAIAYDINSIGPVFLTTFEHETSTYGSFLTAPKEFAKQYTVVG